MGSPAQVDGHLEPRAGGELCICDWVKSRGEALRTVFPKPSKMKDFPARKEGFFRLGSLRW